MQIETEDGPRRGLGYFAAVTQHGARARHSFTFVLSAKGETKKLPNNLYGCNITPIL